MPYNETRTEASGSGRVKHDRRHPDRIDMDKNLKKYLRMGAMGVSVANGYWASMTQPAQSTTLWSPALLAMLSVWVCYFCVAWLMQGMRSK